MLFFQCFENHNNLPLNNHNIMNLFCTLEIKSHIYAGYAAVDSKTLF